MMEIDHYRVPFRKHRHFSVLTLAFGIVSTDLTICVYVLRSIFDSRHCKRQYCLCPWRIHNTLYTVYRHYILIYNDFLDPLYILSNDFWMRNANGLNVRLRNTLRVRITLTIKSQCICVFFMATNPIKATAISFIQCWSLLSQLI